MSLKHDSNLFLTLYIAFQVRDADLDDFLFENHSFPPSLSDYGNMRLRTKADLLQCLEDLVSPNDSACSQREAHMIIIDGAALVNILKPAMSETFDDYASMFMEHIRRQFVLFVVLASCSMCTDLTASRRPDGEKEGTGQRDKLRVERSYLQTDQSSCETKTTTQQDNKAELFNILSERVTADIFPGNVVITHGCELLCSEATSVE